MCSITMHDKIMQKWNGPKMWDSQIGQKIVHFLKNSIFPQSLIISQSVTVSQSVTKIPKCNTFPKFNIFPKCNTIPKCNNLWKCYTLTKSNTFPKFSTLKKCYTLGSCTVNAFTNCTSQCHDLLSPLIHHSNEERFGIPKVHPFYRFA